MGFLPRSFKHLSIITLLIIVVIPLQGTSANSTIAEIPYARLIHESPMEIGGWMDTEKVQLTDNGTHIFVWTTHYGNQPNESNKYYHTRLYLDTDQNNLTGMDQNPGIDYILDFYAYGDGHEIWMYFKQWNQTTQEKKTLYYEYPDLPEGFDIFHDIRGNYIGLCFPISEVNLTRGQTFDFHVQTGSKIQARLDQQVTYTVWNNTDIIVDGEPDDWAGISPIIVDPVEQSQIAEFDLTNFFITDNGLTLFLMFDTRGTPTSSPNHDFHINRRIVSSFDIDQDNETGRRIGEIGEEYENSIIFLLTQEGQETYSYHNTYDESGNDDSFSYDLTSAAWGSVFEWKIQLREDVLNISIGDTIDIYIDEFDEEMNEFFYDIPLRSYTITPDPPFVWDIMWGGNNLDSGYGLATNGDNVYITGSSFSFGTERPQGILVKYDQEGNQLWNTTWGTPFSEEGQDILLFNEHLFIIGNSYPENSNNVDILLQKYDLNGTQIWNRTWGGVTKDLAYSIDGDSGGIYFAGQQKPVEGGNYDSLLVKFDTDGNQIWNETWGSDDVDDHSYGLTVVNGDVYVTGGTHWNSYGITDLFLLKYNSEGVLLANATWGEWGWDVGLEASHSEDSIYVVGHSTKFSELYGYHDDAVVIKFDLDVNLIWNISWGGVEREFGYDIAYSNGSVYISGLQYSSQSLSNNVFLTVFDSDGNYQWNTTWGGTNDDCGYGVAVASEGIYVAGYTWSYGAGDSDLFLVKYSLSTSIQQINLQLGAGWNMISLSVLPDDPMASSVLSDVGFYQLVTWSGTGYVTASEFEAGHGYWLLVLEDTNVTISGDPVDWLNLTLSPGWGMIGGLNSNVQAADVFPEFYQLVTWTGTGYTPATVFEPGKGYWALVLAETKIQLPPT